MPILKSLSFLLCLVIVGCSNPEGKSNTDNSKTNKIKGDSSLINESNSSWIDTLNNRVIDKTLNIYDPDKFLKGIINDTSRLAEFTDKSSSKNDYAALSFALNMLGKNMLNSSNYLMAIQYHKQAYDVALSANDEYLEALSLNMMGVVYRRKSAVKTALEYYTRALKTAEESDITNDYMLKSMAISNEGIGGLYRLLGQYESAITYYKQSLQYEEKLGSLLGMAINHHNIGKSFGYLGQYDLAINHHNKSLEYNTQMNSVLGKAICYNSLGNIAMLQHKYAEAFKLFVPALSLAEQSGDSTYIVNSNINLGWYYIVNNNPDSANTFIQKAIGISKRIGNKSAQAKAFKMLSDLEQNRGNYPKALQYFKEANIYKDEIENGKNQQYLVDLTILHDIEKSKRTIEKLQYNAKLNKRMQYSKNIVIGLLGVVAFILAFLIFQKLQAIKKNKVIHTQKEEMFDMKLELEVLQNKRLTAENKQKDSEKQLLKNELTSNELARQNEITAMQKEIDHKNRELASAAAYAIKKGESMRAFLESIDKLKLQKNDSKDALDKLRNDIEGQMNPDSDWENFSLHFEKVHPNYFKNLKMKHPNITNNELRLCSYLIMNLSDKEIALLLFVSSETVQKAKYRLKKKLLLPADVKLFDYLLSV